MSGPDQEETKDDGSAVQPRTQSKARVGSRRKVSASLIQIITGAVSVFVACSASAASVTFEKDIRPILKAHCFDCHGEGEKLRGGLDLRLRRLMIKGGNDGPVIVPGKPEKSHLF